MAKHKSSRSTTSATKSTGEAQDTNSRPKSPANSTSTHSTKTKKSKKPTGSQAAPESNGTKKKKQTEPPSTTKRQLSPLTFPATTKTSTMTSTSDTISATARPQDPSSEDAFVQAYLRQMVAEFGDDIDAVRSANDFKAAPDSALEILIDGLKMGVGRVPVELRIVPKEVGET